MIFGAFIRRHAFSATALTLLPHCRVTVRACPGIRLARAPPKHTEAHNPRRWPADKQVSRMRAQCRVMNTCDECELIHAILEGGRALPCDIRRDGAQSLALLEGWEGNLLYCWKGGRTLPCDIRTVRNPLYCWKGGGALPCIVEREGGHSLEVSEGTVRNPLDCWKGGRAIPCNIRREGGHSLVISGGTVRNLL